MQPTPQPTPLMPQAQQGQVPMPQPQTVQTPMPTQSQPGSVAPQATQAPMPTASEFKGQQTNILAALIPQIMNAMGGGDARTQQVLQQQQAQNDQRMKKQNLMGFMRSVTMKETGKITPELIMKQAQAWGVDPQQAMGAINAFTQFRKQQQGEKQKYFRQMPGGGTQTIEARQGDPTLNDIDGWMRGQYTPDKAGAMPFGSSKMGIFDKRTGQITQKAPSASPGLVKVPDGKGGWRIVEKRAGMSGMNNPSKGMRIKTNPDGSTEIMTGVNNNGGALTTSTKSNVQKKLIEAIDTYGGLKAASDRYDDSFLKGRDKLGYATTAFKEKWDLGNVSDGDREQLRGYTKFKRDSISSLNNYIKQITGAAMSEAEASRLMKGMPNPGTGLFDGDSPTQFKSKMASTQQQLGRVIARAKYVLNNGLNSHADITLDGMDDIIDARGEEIEQRIKTQDPGATDSEIIALVAKQLKEEFGAGK